jgi:hypothetical protein
MLDLAAPGTHPRWRYTIHVHQDALCNRLAGTWRRCFWHRKSWPYARRFRGSVVWPVGLSSAGPSAGGASRLLDCIGHCRPGVDAWPLHPGEASSCGLGVNRDRSVGPPGFRRLGFARLAAGGSSGFPPLLVPAYPLRRRHEDRSAAGPGGNGGSRLLGRGTSPEKKGRLRRSMGVGGSSKFCVTS